MNARTLYRILNGPFNATLTDYSNQGKLNPQTLSSIIKVMQRDNTPKENIILALVWLSLSPREFKQVVHTVLSTPSDWTTFINLCRKGTIRTGIGRCIKRELTIALSTFPPTTKSTGIQAQLYQIARPKPKHQP